MSADANTSGKLVVAEGGPRRHIGPEELEKLVGRIAAALGRHVRKVLLLPPDMTRLHSKAGEITSALYRELGSSVAVDVLPATGTHVAMSPGEIARMYPGIPLKRFHAHDWRAGVVRIGEIPGAFIREISGGRLRYSIEVALDKLIVKGGYDAIVSIGQVVPHEVAGMANHNKNVLVGAGGRDMINKTHFLGAVCGMESIMGRADTPVRRAFDYAEEHFLGCDRIFYALTVTEAVGGQLKLRGLYAGTGREPFRRAAALAVRANLKLLDKPIHKAVVFLDPAEFKSTWLGNKAIYRTRMAMADAGELLVLAPGVQRFGEDATVDRLIRQFGYHGTSATLAACRKSRELRQNYSAAAHLIHGSTEGRFRVIYAPGGLSRKEIEGVGYEYADIQELLSRYPPAQLKTGRARHGGEEIFFIPNPALGLWALKSSFAAG